LLVLHTIMRMFTALIVDDEERSRRTLGVLLKDGFPELQILGFAKDVKSGLEQIEKLKPAIVFLDIQMPDGTGFDLLRQIGKIDFEIIFTTAYDQFALDAFQMSAIGYLLKPIEEAELQQVVNKAIQLVMANSENKSTQINYLLDSLDKMQNKLNKLFLPDTDGFQVVELDEIIRLEGDRNYTRLHFTNKNPILSSHNLGWFEKLLNNKGFYRVSKGHLINLSFVVRYTKTDGGSVLMIDQANLPVSDTKKEEFRNLFI